MPKALQVGDTSGSEYPLEMVRHHDEMIGIVRKRAALRNVRRKGMANKLP